MELLKPMPAVRLYYPLRECQKQDDNRIGVNARMLPAEILSAIPVKKFDGTDIWNTRG